MLSEPRMTPYLSMAGDRATALKLYEWSARTSAAAFELVGHVEVLLRNALDACLREHFDEDRRGIPWFLLPLPGGEDAAQAIAVVRERLRQENREYRHQVIAGLSFGFWTGLLGPKYEELWRAGLRHAFPGSDGTRKQVVAAAERVRKFRNRLAHHDSVIKVDIPFQERSVLELAGYISPDAATWLRHSTSVMEIYAQRPVAVADTVVVPGKEAWSFYGKHRAYVCQAGRAFRPVERMAFYADREVKPELPAVVHRRDDVEWSDREVGKLRASGDRADRKIATLIEATAGTMSQGRYQVFLLTRYGDSRHRRLAGPIPHDSSVGGDRVREEAAVRVLPRPGNGRQHRRTDLAVTDRPPTVTG
ncbi:hypothetical protein [Crossiella equi]|nr:hypothetical protein [Crossiella equi]